MKPKNPASEQDSRFLESGSGFAETNDTVYESGFGLLVIKRALRLILLKCNSIAKMSTQYEINFEHVYTVNFTSC